MNIRTDAFWKRSLAAIAVAVTAFGVFGSGVASAEPTYTLKGAVTCANIDMYVLPSSTPGYMLSRIRVGDAVLCLVNAERTARGSRRSGNTFPFVARGFAACEARPSSTHSRPSPAHGGIRKTRRGQLQTRT